MKPTKEQIIALLDAWIRQRPGLDYGNYGDPVAYRAEVRSIGQDLQHARTLLRAVELSSMPVECLIEGFRAFSGRLSLIESPKGWGLDYTTGQYWPTEYRKAACAVLSAALWAYNRENMPAPIMHRVESYGKWSGSQFVHEKSAPMGIHAACELLCAKGGQQYGSVTGLYRDSNGRPTLSAGDYIRHQFKRQFGRTIANRWFN